MAGVTCPSCGTTNGEDEALCRNCFTLLADGSGQAREKTHDPAPSAPPAMATPPKTRAPTTDAPTTCPVCGADVPSPTNLVCVDCLEPLPGRVAAESPARTRREAPAALRLVFNGQAIEVPQGTSLIGRDPSSPLAELLSSRDNVSRRHATIGLEPGGRAWVRDEHSANGTFVNDVAVRDNDPTPLADGDRLRLASDVIARVQLGRTTTP